MRHSGEPRITFKDTYYSQIKLNTDISTNVNRGSKMKYFQSFSLFITTSIANYKSS